MKILLIHQFFLSENDAGGSRWNEFVKFFTENGHQVSVLAGMVHYTKAEKSTQKYFETQQINPNLSLIRCYVSPLYHKNYIGRFWAYFTFVFSCFWAACFKIKEKPDLIIATSPPLHAGLIGYLLSKLKNVPFILEVRDLWPLFAVEMGVLKNKNLIQFAYWIEYFLYQNAQQIVVLTPAFKQNIVQRFVKLSPKIAVIPNGVDTDFLKVYQDFDVQNFRQKMTWNNKNVIIYVGAFGLANHLEQVVDTAEMLQNTNILFVLIGEGKQKEALTTKIKEKKLKNVSILPAVPKKDIFGYILSADAGLSVLKKTDGFKTIYSNKTFDYMLCKKPVLMAIDGISKELIENANAGIFLEPENPNDWNIKLRTYFQEPEVLIQHGKNGYHFACEHFDRKKAAETYLGVIADTVK